MDDQNLYIAGVGMVTGLGSTVDTVYNAVEAGLNCYSNSGYVTKKHIPVRMALVPQEALPELNDDIPFCGSYTRWDKHLLQLAHAALIEAVQGFSGEQAIPLILSCPEHYPQWPHQLPKEFLSSLSLQSGIPFCPQHSRLLHVGRSGVIDSVALAKRLLTETDAEAVLVGGVDSYQRPNLLHGLLEDGRISGPGVMDGFTPGEGAGFLLLTTSPELALGDAGRLLRLGKAGEGNELGHMYSDEPYRGEGLAQAVNDVFTGVKLPQVSAIYSSMNGEGFWAKELGVALTRNHKHIGPHKPDVEHPADCFGDLGAATGAVLIALSAKKLLEDSKQSSHLICCSSDHAYRAAISVTTQRKTEISQEAQV